LNKKVILVGLVLLNSVQALPTQAEPFPSIAVIDSGINTSLFKDNIVYEVCIVSEFTCPNGKQIMEGVGAANTPISTNKVLSHGTAVVSVILQSNPSAKIVMIRIVGIDSKGKPADYYLSDIDMALRWVVNNQKKYNISVVNISQGNTFSTCRVSATFKKDVQTLKKINVPVVTAAGNDGIDKPVWSPGCWKETVSVGATHLDGTIKFYSNSKGKIDFFVNDDYSTLTMDGSIKQIYGTSISAAVISAHWLLQKNKA
jgi:subtilisin family serine protease